jgi:dipeptide/tripeptide permease
MTSILLGALLVLVGVMYMAYQPLRRHRLSGGRRLPPDKPANTLEPINPEEGFGIRAVWPGLALVAVGALLLLTAGL